MASQTAAQPTLTEIYLRQGVGMLTLVGVLMLIAFLFFRQLDLHSDRAGSLPGTTG
jgi:hypothetical protein